MKTKQTIKDLIFQASVAREFNNWTRYRQLTNNIRQMWPYRHDKVHELMHNMNLAA